jgi:hypothetical protein
MKLFECKQKVGKDKFVLNKLALNNKIVELESVIEKNQIGLDYEKLKLELSNVKNNLTKMEDELNGYNIKINLIDYF